MTISSQDPLLKEITDTLSDENRLGVILAAQMGGTPEEVQVILQTTAFDAAEQGLKPDKTFVIRCLGVQEHRVSLGLFNTMVYVETHPLLWNHNFAFKQVYFRGTPKDVNDLMLDLNQLYGATYGPFRNLADNINRSMPLGTLLSSGHGLLGEMPEPIAEKVKTLLENHGLSVRFVDTELKEPPVKFSLLVMDDSFFIAQLYSAEPMNKN